MNRTLLGLILNSYTPTLLVVNGVFIALLGVLLWFTVGTIGMGIPLGLLVLVFAFALGQELLAIKVYRARLARGAGESDITFPPETLQPLPKLVAKVARQRKQLVPDRIIISAASEAQGRVEFDGSKTLALGGQSVTLLTEKLLSSVIGHALASLASPETRFLTRHRDTIAALRWMENWFRLQQGRYVNPFLWLLRGVHRLGLSLYAARSREEELRADRAAAAASSDVDAAAALVAIYTLPEVTYRRIDAIADMAVKAGERLDKIFAEHYERAKTQGPGDWENSFKKALRRETTSFSLQPPLKERLRALGVAPKRAFEVFQKDSGAAFRETMSAWPLIDQKLIHVWIALFRLRQEEQEEYGEILSTW